MSEIEKPIMREINGCGERGELIAGVIKAGERGGGRDTCAGGPTYLWPESLRTSGDLFGESCPVHCTNRDLGRNRDVRRVSPGSTRSNFGESGGRVSRGASVAVIH